MEGISRFLSELFQTVLNLSLVGSYVILLVLLVRLVLHKAPRWCSYALWGVVFLRLICPVFPEAGFSLIPSQLQESALTLYSEEASDESMVTKEGVIIQTDSEVAIAGNTGITNNTGTASQALKQQTEVSEAQEVKQDVDVSGKLFSMLSLLWICGALLLGGYHTFSYWRLKIKVRNAVEQEPGIREIQGEHLSFVMGIFKPIIYLSGGLDEESRRVVFCHESVHLQRRDYLFKPAALAICCLHWFNPLVWMAFYLMNRDCEISCDEKVVSLLGEESKKIYSYALLDEATGGERKYYRKGTVCALLSFGEDSVKSRISHILHYKKASMWIIMGAVVLLIILVIGLCSNPGKEPITVERAHEIVMTEGAYAEDSYTHGFLGHYDEDDRQEFFIEIGEKEADANRIKGDLWFVSEDGEAELLLENKNLYMEAENFIADAERFLLVSYLEDGTLCTNVYGVRDEKAVKMIGGQDEKYVDGENIVALCTDHRLEYDAREQYFSGYDQKKYTYYYDGYYIKPHKGYEITREEVEAYENGGEILKSLEKDYPDAKFEYIARENGWLHVNIAYGVLDLVTFYYVTYESTENRLKELEEGPGCYRAEIIAEGGISFVEEIAMEYGWRSDSMLVPSQLSAEMALDRFAWEFTDRNGDALYQLSADKENFENWNMVIPLGDGGYAFGDSSPWPVLGDYQIDYTEGEDEATIRFIMSNSAPEHYVAKEKVKLVKEGELYFVDHVDYKMYSEIQTRQELGEIFNLESENPFNGVNTGYTYSFPRIILQHILNKTNPEYYVRYTDPVTAAKAMLHLGAGTGEVTEQLYFVGPQNPLSSGMGEGSVVNVRYTFAKDGSTVDIPMVLAEESENIWVLSTGDLSKADTQEQGALPNESARKVYAEFAEDGTHISNEGGAFPTYQISNFGVYRLDWQGIRCIYPVYIPQDVNVDFSEGNIYFPTDSQYQEGNLDWMYDSICVLNPDTGEVSFLPISEETQEVFPLS